MGQRRDGDEGERVREPNEASGPADDAAWIQSTLERLEVPLVRFALGIVGDLEAARDVVQDAFLRLVRQPRAEVEGHVGSWLFTVVRRRALDVRKKEARLIALDDVSLAERPSDAPAPPALAEASELARTLLGLARDLPPNQAEVLRLKFQGGLSYKEIAAITGHSVSNVGFLLHVAVKSLRARAQAGVAARA